MKFLDSLLRLFFTCHHIESSMENDESFRLEVLSQDYLCPSVDDIISATAFLISRDHLKMTFSFGSADPLTLNFNDVDIEGFSEKLAAEYAFQEEEEVKFNLEIKKTKIDDVISIYSLKNFVEHLSKLSIAQGFAVFSRALSESKGLIFEVVDLPSTFATETIFFIPRGQILSLPDELPDRNKLLEKQRSSVLFANTNSFNLVPDDLRLSPTVPIDPILQSVFGRYCGILSCIYIMDISALESDSLSYTINGYKSIKSIATFNLPHPSSEQYYNIYKWTYTGGNLTDKLGLTRNIVTLHFDPAGNLILKGRPYESILSSYKVYEKQNIKQYIEIRNKISDQLLDFNNRANKIIETFASGFQKSALALISFYLSAIVVKVLGKIDQYHIFSTEATVLSLVFIVGSFIYYRGAKWEVTEQRKRFVSSYENLKLRYTDLLNSEDVKRIVNDDKEYKEDLVFIDGKMKVYSRIWLGLLGMFLMTTVFLYLLGL